MAKFVIHKDTPEPQDEIRIGLVEEDGKPTLVIVDGAGDVVWYLASIDEDGLHLWSAVYDERIKSDKHGYVKVHKGS